MRGRDMSNESQTQAVARLHDPGHSVKWLEHACPLAEGGARARIDDLDRHHGSADGTLLSRKLDD